MEDEKSKSPINLKIIYLACLVSFSFNVVMVCRLREQVGIKAEEELAEISKDLKNPVCAGYNVFDTSVNHVSSKWKTIRVSTRDLSLCCIDEAENLITLMNIMLMRSYSKGTAPGMETVSAHLYLDTLTDRNYSWTDEFGFGTGHLTENLDFRKGRFVVKKTGLYNLYSFITFKREDLSVSPLTLVHSVRKLSPRSNEPWSVAFLERRTELPGSGQTFRTSYLSGMVSLNASDELYVDVSHVNLIYRYAPANFFGLHLLDEMQ